MVLIYRLIHIETPILINSLLTKYQFKFNPVFKFPRPPLAGTL